VHDKKKGSIRPSIMHACTSITFAAKRRTPKTILGDEADRSGGETNHARPELAQGERRHPEQPGLGKAKGMR
jgi:hypothetical protein